MRFITHVKKQANSNLSYSYKIADTVYRSDLLVPQLSSLITKEYAVAVKDCPTRFEKNIKYQSPIYRQKILVGEHFYEIEVKSNSNNDYLLIADNNHFSVTKFSITVFQESDPIILLGPALIINLALNNVFCLHASACIVDNKAFVFLAESGTGKSTIARFIGEFPNHQRIADDIVPIKIVSGQAKLLTNFPQLKLSPSQQYTGEDIDLKVHLMFVKTDESNKVSMTKLNPIESLKCIISHSIATRLFNASQLKSHFEFCQSLYSKSESYHVSYQHNPSSLNELLSCLNEI